MAIFSKLLSDMSELAPAIIEQIHQAHWGPHGNPRALASKKADGFLKLDVLCELGPSQILSRKDHPTPPPS